MKDFLLLLLALLLLIPTIGVSIVIWLYFKNKYNKNNIQLILNKVEKSSQSSGEVMFLETLNNVSMKMVMKKLKAHEAIFEADAFLGAIQHPTLGCVYLVIMKSNKGIYICKCNNEFEAQRKMFKMDLQRRSQEGLSLSKV